MARRAELEEARRAIASVLGKCEKAHAQLSERRPPPKAQLTLLARRIQAFRIARSLIARELKAHKK